MKRRAWLCCVCLATAACSSSPTSEQVSQRVGDEAADTKRAAAGLILEILHLNQTHSELGFKIASTRDPDERRTLIEAGKPLRALILEYGEILDVEAANSIYPSLGTNISSQLIAPYQRLEEIITEGDFRGLSEVLESQQAFAEWLNPRKQEIEVALNLALAP